VVRRAVLRPSAGALAIVRAAAGPCTSIRASSAPEAPEEISAVAATELTLENPRPREHLTFLESQQLLSVDLPAESDDGAKLGQRRRFEKERAASAFRADGSAFDAARTSRPRSNSPQRRNWRAANPPPSRLRLKLASPPDATTGP
jgi:hypothetical protein